MPWHRVKERQKQCTLPVCVCTCVYVLRQTDVDYVCKRQFAVLELHFVITDLSPCAHAAGLVPLDDEGGRLCSGTEAAVFGAS